MRHAEGRHPRVIAQTGTGGGQGYMVEYRGRRSSRCHGGPDDGRNMTIEWAPAPACRADETHSPIWPGRSHAPTAPSGRGGRVWTSLRTDDDAEFDAEITLDAITMAPFVTWGTTPDRAPPRQRIRACPAHR